MSQFYLMQEIDNFVYDSARDRLVHNAANVEVEQEMGERMAERAEFYRDMARELDCE